jgi:hypothetical protein
MFYGEKFLGAFVKFRKATISFVVTVCPIIRLFVLPRGTTLLPLNGFS